MNELTLVLAVIVAVAHFAVIFWPRKPINEPTHKDGMPIIWHNRDDSRKDIACVWSEGAEKAATVISEVEATSITSFSESPTEASEDKRSAA